MSPYKKRIACVLLFLAAALALAHFCIATSHTLLIGFKDIDVFLYRLWAYLKGDSFYYYSEPLSRAYEAGRSVLKFPPIYVVPYLPWVDAATGIDHRIYHLFFYLHVFRYMLAFLLCGFFLGPRKNVIWWLLLVIMFSLCAPFYEALYGLTFDNLFLFLLVSALVLLKFRQRFMPIALLSYAASAKIYPVVQLIPFLVVKNWRMASYCILMMLFWLCVSVAFFGVAPHEFYFFRIFPILLKEDILCEVGNLSIAGQLCTHRELLMALKIFFTLSTLTLAFFVTRNTNRTFENDSLLYSLLICLPLLVMQNVWGNYQVILLLPFCVLLGYAFSQNGWLKYSVIMAIFVAWLPLVVSDNYPAMDLFYYSWLGNDTPRFMIDHMKPFSALLLWCVLAFLLLRQKWLHQKGLDAVKIAR